MLRSIACACVSISFVLGAQSAGAAEAKGSPADNLPGKVAIGTQIGEFTFKDIRYLPRNLGELGPKKAYVVVFSTLECPLAKRYMPRIVELEKQFRDQDVQFVVMNVGVNDPIVEVANQALELDAPFPFCKDLDGEAVRALGVSRTPEAVVLDADRKLRYRGRIDSQYRLGGVKDNAGREDLKLAIEDVLAGRDVATSETPVDGCKITLAATPEPATPVTFAEHVAPLMQKHCQDCHHDGGTAPFGLISYEDVEANAAMIAEVVKEQRMPPMYASRAHGEFTNLRKMSDEERTTIAQWVAGGRKQGDMAKAPAPRTFSKSQWLIGEPDMVLKIPTEVKIPADGILPYQYKLLHNKSKAFPYSFPHDTWITATQILPGNKQAVHHCNMACIDPKAKYSDAQFITGQVPGGQPMILDHGVGFKIPKGSVLVLQLHYVTTGEATTDQTQVGFVFAKEPIQKQLKHFRCHNGKFAITPGDPHHPVGGKRTLDCDATGVGMFSHMHVRGKDMVFNAIYPDGKRETLLSIPNYSFDWQMAYQWDVGKKKFPKGTVIDVLAHYDNSQFNPYNPDPKQTVREGDQTFEEMMYGFFFYTDDSENLNLTIDPKTGKVVDGVKEAAKPSAKDAQASAGG